MLYCILTCFFMRHKKIYISLGVVALVVVVFFLIAAFVIEKSIDNYYFPQKTKSDMLPTVEIIKERQTISLSSDVQVLNVTLLSTEIPEVRIPGNRPLYHLEVESDGRYEKITFDPFDSPKYLTVFGSTFEIRTTDNEGELMVVSKE